MLATPDQIQPRVEFSGFEEEPMVTKRSYLYGEINLYAPIGPMNAWSYLPWMLTSKNGEGGMATTGFKHIIKASAIQHCLNHASIIGATHLYVGPELEPEDLD